MRRKTGFLLAAIVALLGACAAPNQPTTNTASSNANANTNASSNATSSTTAPSKDMLAGLEKQAFEAWKNKDGKFFDGLLAANFMMFDGSQRFDKAATTKMIGANPCEVKNYSMSDEQVTPVSADVAVITMKVTADVTCEGKPMPSPVTSSTIYVKQGNDWKAAFHAEVPIVDPSKNSGDKAGAPAPPPGSAATQSQPNSDLTAKLLEREKMGWDAWKNHDQTKLNEFVADGASAVGMFGERMASKADIVKSWSEPCDVKNVTLSNEHAVEIAPGVALLFYKGTAAGKCGEMDIKPEWAATLYTKQGDTWRGAFFLASPA